MGKVGNCVRHVLQLCALHDGKLGDWLKKENEKKKDALTNADSDRCPGMSTSNASTPTDDEAGKKFPKDVDPRASTTAGDASAPQPLERHR